MSEVDELLLEAREFIKVVNDIEIENEAAKRSREALEARINEIVKDTNVCREALDIASNAIEILRKVSDEAVRSAYKFLEEQLNKALEEMFKNTVRKISLEEDKRGNYPQLEIRLHVGKKKTRSLKSDSGHGIAQIVSLLSILSLIVITGSRRLLVMDEIISGVSAHNKRIIDDILWAFTEIGFQFIIVEHAYIPKGSHVYEMEMVGDVSGVKSHYIADKGVYSEVHKKPKDETYGDIEDIQEVVSI